MGKEKNTSEALLTRYLASSSQAPFLIHERYHTRLIQFARAPLMGVLNSKVDPEDVAQETFLAFFDLADRGGVRWQKNGDLWRLLAGIAANKTKQKFEHYAAAKRDIKSETGQQSEATEAAVNNESATKLTELVDYVLSTEKPLFRSVLEMRLGGFNNQEIGKKIGRSARTVRRVLEALQAKLIADNDLEFGRLLATKPSNPVAQPDNQKETKRPLDAPPNLVPFEDFQLLRMIGQGSFAKVYLAKQISSGEIYAIKSIRKKWFSNLTARTAFFNEARILKQLNHPNVVKTFGLGKLPNGGCFLVLELVEGTSILKAAKHADPKLVQHWAINLDSTIKMIHDAGIIHGDLRPDNILVDTKGEIRIVDFGLSELIQKTSKAKIENDLQAIRSIKENMKAVAGVNQNKID